MAALQCSHRRSNVLVSHHKLDLPLPYVLDLASLPNERLAAVQRAELALAEDLPGAVVIGAYSPGTGGE